MLERIVDGRTDLVFELVESGGPVSQRDEGGVSLAAWCAYYGDVSALRFLLSHGAKLQELGDDLGLNAAAFHGHWRLCQFLLEQGADVNAALPDTGETPLHAALSKAQRPAYDLVVEVLLAAGANPAARTRAGVETGAFMRDARTRGEAPLHRAAAFGTERAIDLLLAAGADREARDAYGDSPLAWASWHLRPASVLSKLCFGEHSVHPRAVEEATSDHGAGFGSLMERSLLGRVR